MLFLTTARTPHDVFEDMGGSELFRDNINQHLETAISNHGLVCFSLYPLPVLFE